MCVGRCCKTEGWHVLTGVAGECVVCVDRCCRSVWCVLTGVAGKRVSGVC